MPNQVESEEGQKRRNASREDEYEMTGCVRTSYDGSALIKTARYDISMQERPFERQRCELGLSYAKIRGSKKPRHKQQLQFECKLSI
jgi:hypothetical protein